MAKKRKNDQAWIKWFDAQSAEDQRTIALNAVERLIEIDDVRFRVNAIEDSDGRPIKDNELLEACLYWESCGEDLRCPF